MTRSHSAASVSQVVSLISCASSGFSGTVVSYTTAQFSRVRPPTNRFQCSTSRPGNDTTVPWALGAGVAHPSLRWHAAHVSAHVARPTIGTEAQLPRSIRVLYRGSGRREEQPAGQASCSSFRSSRAIRALPSVHSRSYWTIRNGASYAPWRRGVERTEPKRRPALKERNRNQKDARLSSKKEKERNQEPRRYTLKCDTSRHFGIFASVVEFETGLPRSRLLHRPGAR